MKPKNNIIEKFCESEDSAKVKKLVSLSFLLMNISKTYIEESEELLKKHEMHLGEIKRNLNLTQSNYEKFIHLIRETVNHSKDHSQMDFFEDYEQLEKMISEFAKIDTE